MLGNFGLFWQLNMHYFSVLLGHKESIHVLQSGSFQRAGARDSFFKKPMTKRGLILWEINTGFVLHRSHLLLLPSTSFTGGFESKAEDEAGVVKKQQRLLNDARS